MGIKHKKGFTVSGWLFPTPNGTRKVMKENLLDACDYFQERWGYWPDTRNAEPIFEKDENGKESVP